MNPHQAHATTPRALAASLFAHRELIGQLVRRDVIGRDRGSLLGVAKRVVFPLKILPWVALGSALFHGTASLLVLLVAQLLFNQTLPSTLILFPLLLAPFLMLISGVAWVLAATGIYVRDIAQTSGIITMVMLFLSSVFSPLSSLPARMQIAFDVNPLTFMIEESRKVLLLGQLPSWRGLFVYTVIAVAVAWGGFWWFQKTRRGFADVV